MADGNFACTVGRVTTLCARLVGDVDCPGISSGDSDFGGVGDNDGGGRDTGDDVGTPARAYRLSVLPYQEMLTGVCCSRCARSIN